MNMIRLTALAGIALAAVGFATAPASALTTKECSVKYQAAKEAGTLKGMNWNEFRKAQCADDAAADDDTATTKTKTKKAATSDDDDAAKGLTSKQCSAKYQAAKDAGTLGDMKWNDFRKAECGPGASAEIETTPAKTKTKKAAATDDDAAKGLTSKQCSAKYQAAKEAGTLGDTKWNDFRKAECGPGASAEVETTKTKKKKAAAEDTDDAAAGLSMKECSAKYQGAKEAGTLGDMKWNDFRKAECGPGSTAEIEKTKSKTKSKKASAAPEDEDVAGGLSMKQCSAKYQAAKAADALNGMKWNDYRKAECGPGASAEFEAPKVTKASTSTGGGLSMKECSVKYQSAKESGSLGGLKWNDFRKAKCSADAADDETVPAESEAQYTNEPDAPSVTAPKGVRFPRAISSKYSNESEGKARMHTCLQQYYANKENNALGGLKWIQKGGGYYSLCNARLKGTS